MKQAKELKDIFNEIFPKLKGKEKTPENVSKSFSDLVATNKDDFLIYQFHLFFYPNHSSSEANKQREFWFEKYKSEQPELYTEYNFALDMLEVLKGYLENKDSNSANSIIFDLALKFGSYKNIDYYLFLTEKKIINNLIHIYSFFHKDGKYFNEIINVDVKKTDNLTDKQTLENLFVDKTIKREELNTHKLYIPIINELREKINELTKKVNELKEINETQKVINDELIQFKEETTNKLEQIYLRDTIKYSIKYIYRMFYSKFRSKYKLEFKNNIYEEIEQLKNILSNESFANFSFLKEFMEVVALGDFIVLNKVSHSYPDNRELEDIKKYFNNKKPYLDKVFKFLQELPDLKNYINLEINYYFSKNKLEEEVNKEYNFEQIHENIINA